MAAINVNTSLADSAATINYSVQQTDTEYIFNPVCYFKLDKVEVKSEGGKLYVIPNKRKNKDNELAKSGYIVLPKKADPTATPTFTTSQGLCITVPKLTAVA